MKNKYLGGTWAELKKELVNNGSLSEEDIRESDMRAAIMTELIKARNEKGISQQDLESLSGVKRPVISRMETGKTSPQINTLLKVLAPLGKTLYIGDLK
jgi:DNA-binding XRE family transcriptional regulator